MIAIDTTFFAHSEAKNRKLTYSTSIFTADLLDAFSELGMADRFCLIVNFNHLDFFRERFPDYKIIPAKWRPVTFLYKLTKGKKTANRLIKKSGAFKRTAEKCGATAIWFPYAMNETFVHTKLKTFATIHDIYRIHHGSQKEAKKFTEFINDKSTSIITISGYTRNDIVQTTGCSKEIPVIPNSIEFDVSMQKAVPDIKEKKYILDLNAYIAKKNPLTLLKAFNLIKDKTDLTLVFCGGYKEEQVWKEMQDFIEENSISSRVRMLFRVTDAERNWLLTNTAIFATPSLFEGFGRTPVEAAICKIPVISTKETSLYEATQGLCNYVENAMDEKELADTMLYLIKNPPAEKQLAETAQKLRERYKKENCAKLYLKLFL